jgi:hypothetical protein
VTTPIMRSIIGALTLALACPLLAGPGYQIVEVDQPAAPTGGPTLEAAAIDDSGHILTLGFSVPVSVGAGGTGGLDLTLSSGATTATYLDGAGSSTLRYHLKTPVMPAASVVTVAYTQPGDGLEATTGGGDVATFSGESVTNGSGVISYVNFEDSGYNVVGIGTIVEDVATDGVIDEDYSTAPIADAQSLFLDEGTGGDPSVYLDLGSGYPAIAARVMHKIITKPNANLTNTTAFTFNDSSGTSRASVKYNYTDATDAAAIVAAIATTNGTPSSSTFTGQLANYWWLDYSNTADVVNASWSPTPIKPPAGGVAHSSATASQSATIQRIRFVEPHATKQSVFDELTVYVPAP